ncbi:MAG: FlgD immunoglobulin-like domain containing protein, partial [Dehalococcoidia bacterium]
VTNQAGDVHDDSDAGFSITELRIVSVLDIGNDQGRAVRVRWQRALHDRAATDTTITSYSLWRRVDQYKQSAAVGGSDGGDAQSLYPPGEWDYVLTVPAHGEDLYSTVSPTLCDSTIANGMCWSVFFVRAETPDPLVFFDAPPDSGYSIDNLAPAAPGNFRFLSVGVLAWDESEAADFNYFTVYGSYVDHLEETAEVLGQTTETTMDISGHWFPFYHLTATDFSGNEGEEATAGSTTSAASSGQVPQVFALHQSAPNPGSSGCRISFDLPVQSDVSLKIFDAAGRQVVTLEDRVFEPGSHSISWDGLDASGVAVPSGVYFYRLEAGTFVDSRKILITW